MIEPFLEVVKLLYLLCPTSPLPKKWITQDLSANATNACHFNKAIVVGQTSVWTTLLLGRIIAVYRVIQDPFHTFHISFCSSSSTRFPASTFILAPSIEHRCFSLTLIVHVPEVAQRGHGIPDLVFSPSLFVCPPPQVPHLCLLQIPSCAVGATQAHHICFASSCLSCRPFSHPPHAHIHQQSHN